MFPRSAIGEAKKGSAEILILALVEERGLHGYDLAKQIDERSDGTIRFTLASLYATLFRLEDRAGSAAGGSRKRDSGGAATTGLPTRAGACSRRSVKTGDDSSPRSAGWRA